MVDQDEASTARRILWHNIRIGAGILVGLVLLVAGVSFAFPLLSAEFVARPRLAPIESESMAPTLRAGDYVIETRESAHNVIRGDVLIFAADYTGHARRLI